MNRIERLNVLKDKLKSILKFSDVNEVKLTEVLLKDGTKIFIESEDLAVGASIFVVLEDGTQQPAPDGEHVLEDGTILVVAEGKISEIKPVEPVQEEAKEDVKEEMIDEPVSNDVDQRLQVLETKVDGIINLIQRMLEEQEVMAEEFSKIPGERAIENKKTPFNAGESIDKAEELKKIRERLNKN